MVHKNGRCGLNSGATIRMARFSKLQSRLAAEQHCIVISKTTAKKPNVLTKQKKVTNLQDKVDIDDGHLHPHTPDWDMYTVNKRKRWTIADAVEDYIEDHAEDASHVVLVKREAITSCIKKASYGSYRGLKQTDCTSRHDSKAVVRHSFPCVSNRASSDTDLKEKAFKYDADALQKEVTFPKRSIHNQHARGVQRPIHHPKEGYSRAKKTAIKEYLENWEKENMLKVEDEFDTIKYEVMEPKKTSVEHHNWLHQNALLYNQECPLSRCVRNKSAKRRVELHRRAEHHEDWCVPSYQCTDDKYSTSDLEEEDWEDNWYDNDNIEEDDYMYLSRSSPCRTIGDELFDLISDVEQKQRSECEMLSPDDVEMDNDTVIVATRNDALGDASLKSCTSGHPNSLMGVPTRWYPKGEVFYQQEKKRNISGDSDKDSGVSLDGSNSSLESLQGEEKENMADTAVDLLAYQPPDFVSCSVPFSDIQPTSLSERYSERFMEGESLPGKFSIQIPGPTIGIKSAETFVLFEEADDSLGAMSCDAWKELDEPFTQVNFHIVGNFGEFEKWSVNKELCERFRVKKQMQLADVIDIVVDILQRLPVDSFPPHLPTRKGKPTVGSQMCGFQTLSAVNRWKHDILDPDAAFEIVDKHTTFTESSKELINLEPVDVDVCGVCYEPVSREGAVPATTLKSCLHAFCNDCWLNHLVSRVRQGDVRLTCPGFKCKVLVDHLTVMSLLPWRVYKMHIQHVRDAYIERSGHFSWCPREKCDQVIMSKSGKRDQGQNVACRCGEVWCFNCHQRPHWPATCKQAAEYSKQLHKNGDDKPEFDRVHSIEGKRCPHCSHPIEKNGGCPYMHCSRCRNSFCWTCGKAFGPNHWPCSVAPNETFNLIDHFPGRKRFYLLATMTRSKRLRQVSLCRASAPKKTRSESSYQVMRKFRKTAIYSETKSLWNELNYTIEYSYVVMYFANRRVRSRTIAGCLSMIDHVMDELTDLVTLYVCGQYNSKEYAKRLEGIKTRGMTILKHLRLRLGNQQALIARQLTN